jgi:epoxyqueuosine reductase
LENTHPHDISLWIKSRAEALGFSACGISRADLLEEDGDRLEKWLAGNYQGEMNYMANHLEMRKDPRLLHPGAKSVISVLLNYFPAETLPEKDNYKISKYAYGKDYHEVIREKLNRLVADLKAYAGDFQARAFTDSAPVLDRAWAEKSGLGWIGKNTCLIHPKIGSFVFIGEIITDLELEYDQQRVNDLCGGCTKCIDACPTGAILAPRLLDARKCISYYTIEYRGEIPEGEMENFKDWVFGCDICQDVCPWNRKAKPHTEKDFFPAPGLMAMDKAAWEDLTEEKFIELFSKSAVRRTKLHGLKRNITFVKNKDFGA